MRAALAIAGIALLLPVADARAESTGRWIFNKLFGNPVSLCERSLLPGWSVELGSGFRRWHMPASSMLPAIHVGERLLSVVPRKGRSWQRGDVVVFKLPTDVKVDYVKRILGVPGDTVEIKAGRLYLNGEQVTREGPLPRTDLKTTPPAVAAREGLGKECYSRRGGKPNAARMYRQILPGGRSFRILECSDNASAADNTGKFVVPVGHYFMLGDNRDNSLDSRYRRVGLVPKKLIVGLIICVMRL